MVIVATAISQRNYTEYYEHLQEESIQRNLTSLISDWFAREIKPYQTLTQCTLLQYDDVRSY